MTVPNLGGIQGPVNPLQSGNTSGSNAVKADSIQMAINGMNDALAVIDSEIGAKSDLKKSENFDKSQSSTSANQAQQKEVPPTKLPEDIAAFLLSMTDDVKKKKRKKSTLEEKMEELAELEGNIDTANLSPEEKEIIETFYENMARIKTLKGKFKRLQQQREKAEELVEEQQQQEERDKRLAAQKKESQDSDSNGPVNGDSNDPLTNDKATSTDPVSSDSSDTGDQDG